MFLGQGCTRYAFNFIKAKTDPTALEDVRCSLIGNTFHAGVVAMVFSALFTKRNLLENKPSAQEMVGRQGLYPGEVYVDGLNCGLGRAASFHRMDAQRRGHCYDSFQQARDARSAEGTPELEAHTLTALLRSADYEALMFDLIQVNSLAPASGLVAPSTLSNGFGILYSSTRTRMLNTSTYWR